MMGRPQIPLPLDEIKRLYEDDGLTLTAISRMYGTSLGTISRRLNSMGVATRLREDTRHGTRGMYTHGNCRCEDCSKAAWEYSQENSERRNELNKEKRAAKTQIFAEYKIKMGCIDCGYNRHPSALHFDHINPEDKSFSISTAINVTCSVDRIWEEVTKCEVRCANCHAEKTWPKETNDV